MDAMAYRALALPSIPAIGPANSAIIAPVNSPMHSKSTSDQRNTPSASRSRPCCTRSATMRDIAVGRPALDMTSSAEYTG